MATSLPSTNFREYPKTACSQRISVFIADETVIGCQMLKNTLTRSRFRYEVVGSATTHSEIMRCISARSIDVALSTESLEDGPLSGYRLLSELRASFPHTRVIMLLKVARRDLVIDAFRAGAKGVFCMAEPIQALCKCIQVVHKGQVWANSDQLNFVLEALVGANPLLVTSPTGRQLLAHRENEVATLVAEGMTNRTIAERLGVSVHTVSNHLFRIYEKLGISSRVELVLYVLQQRQHKVAL